jgi:small subunit ribosomal protein S17
METTSQETTAERGRRRVLQGIVVSNGMDKTITVRVERKFRHPKYKKYVSRHKKYAAHDESNTAGRGDTVRIAECRPLSKTKRWRLLEVVERAVLEEGAL